MLLNDDPRTGETSALSDRSHRWSLAGDPDLRLLSPGRDDRLYVRKCHPADTNLRPRREPAHAPRQQQADSESDARKRVNHSRDSSAAEEIRHDFPEADISPHFLSIILGLRRNWVKSARESTDLETI